jgi:glycosyltransferase involved in cell wall biosynthesis
MRLLQVSPYFAPAWAYGGPPRVMYDLATGLVARGHQVDVLTTDVLDASRRATPAEETLDGVRVVRHPNLSNSLAWRTKKYLPRGLLTALVRSVGRYDAVHVTDTRTYLTAAAYLAARGRGVPLCLSAHGSLPGSEGLRGAVKSAYDRVLVRPMLGRAALLLAQTDHEAVLYEHFGGRPETVRQLALPLPPIPADPSLRPGTFRAQIGIAEDAKMLLFLGRVNRLKGLDVLIESVQSLLGQDVVLAVVGRDDGQLAEITDRFKPLFADGRVRFAGPLYGADRFAAYVDADVFCLTPTHWEETSVASLEAAACGTAVVVTEQADLPGLASAGGGFVVPLRADAIHGAVEAALRAGPEMGERARAHVLRQHGSDSVVARLEQYLLEAI